MARCQIMYLAYDRPPLQVERLANALETTMAMLLQSP
jgi:hypothetical protein